jgi:protein involved in polysaccharide export with SLBB domain
MTMKMKSLTIASFILIATLAMATSGQVKSVGAKATAANGNVASAETLQAHAGSDFNQHTKPARFRGTTDVTEKSSPNVSPAGSKIEPKNQKPVSSPNTVGPSSNTVASVNATNPAASSQIYRIGVRDVLDIQLADNPSGSSTLFTILEGGLLDYPFAGDPIVVAGLTTAEIAALLRQRIKIFDNPTVVVNVRDYASHAVTVTGFVAAPGTKALRREAVPLYTILAEAQALPEATRATILRQGRASFIVDFKNANLLSTLVVTGDAIKVSGMSAEPGEFFFIGGEINSPGQKPYHPGLTLTQAILASGGTSTSAAAKVRVSRQGADGKLTIDEFNLRSIQTGKTPDPRLQKGDRVEVTNGN